MVSLNGMLLYSCILKIVIVFNIKIYSKNYYVGNTQEAIIDVLSAGKTGMVQLLESVSQHFLKRAELISKVCKLYIC